MRRGNTYSASVAFLRVRRINKEYNTVQYYRKSAQNRNIRMSCVSCIRPLIRNNTIITSPWSTFRVKLQKQFKKQKNLLRIYSIRCWVCLLLFRKTDSHRSLKKYLKVSKVKIPAKYYCNIRVFLIHVTPSLNEFLLLIFIIYFMQTLQKAFEI